MSGRKNIYQQYGVMPNALNGKDIWARNEQFLGGSITVHCRKCGKTIDAPSKEGPGAYGMDIYQMELQHSIHQHCARELDRDGIKY